MEPRPWGRRTAASRVSVSRHGKNFPVRAPQTRAARSRARSSSAGSGRSRRAHRRGCRRGHGRRHPWRWRHGLRVLGRRPGIGRRRRTRGQRRRRRRRCIRLIGGAARCACECECGGQGQQDRNAFRIRHFDSSTRAPDGRGAWCKAMRVPPAVCVAPRHGAGGGRHNESVSASGNDFQPRPACAKACRPPVDAEIRVVAGGFRGRAAGPRRWHAACNREASRHAHGLRHARHLG